MYTCIYKVVLILFIRFIYILLFICFALPIHVSGAADRADKPAELSLEDSALPEPVRQKEQQRWAAFPVIASSPETGFMLGGMIFHFFPVSNPDEQASTIDIIGYGTTKGQYGLILSPNILTRDGLYRFKSVLFARFWKGNYYMTGNDSPDDSEKYESTDLGTTVTLERRFFNALFLGITGRYKAVDIETDDDGILSTGSVRGSDDGSYAGAGLSAGYDTRDNTNGPAAGVLAKYEFMHYDRDMGSDLDFDIHKLQLSHYRTLSYDSVLALAAHLERATGDIPFSYLPSPDGTRILRGIENGRYSDNNMIAFQSEYRFPIRGKFSGTAFLDIAQVAHHLDEISSGEFKSSVGGGIRYALNQDQRFNLRLDMSWVDSGFGIIINVREAF